MATSSGRLHNTHNSTCITHNMNCQYTYSTEIHFERIKQSNLLSFTLDIYCVIQEFHEKYGGQGQKQRKVTRASRRLATSR